MKQPFTQIWSNQLLACIELRFSEGFLRRYIRGIKRDKEEGTDQKLDEKAEVLDNI